MKKNAEQKKYVGTLYFHKVKFQFLRQYYRNLKSHFDYNVYTMSPTLASTEIQIKHNIHLQETPI